MTGIIILNYNNWEDTINCINSVEKHNTASIKFIVVDNGSRNESAKELDLYFSQKYNNNYNRISQYSVHETLPYISLIVNKENVGYARGNNIGLHASVNDCTITNILILNNDILFIEDIIPHLLDTQKKFTNSAIITPLLLTKDGKSIDYTCARNQYTVQQEIAYNFLHYICPKKIDKILQERYILLINKISDSIIPIQVPSGSCMLIDKSFFNSINFFDPNTFLYWEESILYEKVRQNNRQNYLNTEVKCIHLGGASTHTSVSSRFCLHCGNHSARYYMKHYSNCGTFWYAIFCISTIFNLGMFELRNLLKKIKS